MGQDATDAAELIRSALLLAGDRALLVGIDGPGGGGKSTLARRLAHELGVDTAVVEGDDFYAEIDWEERAGFSPQDGYERDYDWVRLRDQVLGPARDGAPELRYQRYDWDSRRLGGWVARPQPTVLVVEGLYVLRPELRERYDVRLCVDAPEALRRERMRARHAQYDPATQALHDAMTEVWLGVEHLYFERHDPRPSADLVIMACETSG